MRNLPAIRGNVDFQAHIAESLVNDEFDLTVFQDKPIDHGCASPLPLLWPHEPDWPGTVVPIAINVLQYPLPTARRCYRLGQAVRRAIESYPGRPARWSWSAPAACRTRSTASARASTTRDWDMQFLDLLQNDPEALTSMTHADFVRLGGAESVEQIMWLAMRGALGRPHPQAAPELLPGHHHRHDGGAVRGRQAAGPRPQPSGLFGFPEDAMNPQLQGLEDLEGTYVFDLRVSNRALKLNRFFWNMIGARGARRFVDDTEQAMQHAGLNDAGKGAGAAPATGSAWSATARISSCSRSSPAW